MSIDDLCYTPGEEIPEYHSTIITPYSQKGSMSVKGTGDGHTDTVQGSIEILEKNNNLSILSAPNKNCSR